MCRSWNEMKCSLYWTVSSGDSWILQSKHVCEGVFFIFNLVFENEFGAMLPALDTEALFLSPEWVLLGLTAWQFQPLPICLSLDERRRLHLVMRRMKDMLRAAQSLASGLFCPGLWGHLLVKDHITWPKKPGTSYIVSSVLNGVYPCKYLNTLTVARLLYVSKWKKIRALLSCSPKARLSGYFFK